MLFSFYFYLAGLFVGLSDPNIYSLHYHWNKASLAALHTAAASANTDEERTMYKNRLDVMSDIWKMEPGRVNNKSLRWLFLEQISADFDWKNKAWSVIEVKKSGERISLLNYLVCYEKKQTKIIMYDYQKDRWVKVKEKKEHLKFKALVRCEDKVPINEGKNFNEIIVTDFNSALPLRSMFYIETTLSQNSIITGIISH